MNHFASQHHLGPDSSTPNFASCGPWLHSFAWNKPITSNSQFLNFKIPFNHHQEWRSWYRMTRLFHHVPIFSWRNYPYTASSEPLLCYIKDIAHQVWLTQCWFWSSHPRHHTYTIWRHQFQNDNSWQPRCSVPEPLWPKWYNSSCYACK